MIKWMRRLNEALPMLVLGIVIFSVLVELIGVWFVSDKLRYTTGLFIGMGLAIFLAINISMVIWDSVRLGEGHAKRLAFKSVLRYFVVCIVLFLMMAFKAGNLFTALAGIMGLKVSAYAQPLLNKLFNKNNLRGNVEMGVSSDEDANLKI